MPLFWRRAAADGHVALRRHLLPLLWRRAAADGHVAVLLGAAPSAFWFQRVLAPLLGAAMRCGLRLSLFRVVRTVLKRFRDPPAKHRNFCKNRTFRESV